MMPAVLVFLLVCSLASSSAVAPYTCDDLLGDDLCPLDVVRKTVSVRGVEMFYWVYQKKTETTSPPEGLPVIVINGGTLVHHTTDWGT